MKNVMMLSVVAVLWGCGGAPEQQDTVKAVDGQSAGQSEQGLASTDPLIGTWVNSSGYAVTVYAQNFGKLVATPDSTCWPVGRVLWDYLQFRQTNADGTRTYWGQGLWSPCPGWNSGSFYNTEWIVSGDGKTVSMRFEGNTPDLYTRQ
ncbi:hypothetical protein [Archangium sp.]|uniref:hypothetical protein n=1 Tax=Archangium sp. TaxID=1872627 RepID=UPI00286B56DE|nr:hypothetical protein [Archangium sp.]